MTTTCKFSGADLIERAEKCVERLEYEAASKFLLKACELNPDSVDVLDLFGEVLVELGDHDKAYEVFSKSISLKPDQNPAKWMNYAQLQVGMDAVHSYTKGLQLLIEEKTACNVNYSADEQRIKKIDEQIVSACCAMVERYTTDCCDEPQAESECERLIAFALSILPKSPEALQTFTNLRMIQQRLDEAKESLSKVLEFLAQQEQAELLPYSFRIETLKMCYELEQFEACASLAEELLQENDDELQVWYFAGMSYFKQTPPDFASASEYLTHTLKV